MEESLLERVWIQEHDRWYPAILERWETRDGQLLFGVSYAVPVNGWPGGWYEDVLGVEGDADPNDEGLSWSTRVQAARQQ